MKYLKNSLILAGVVGLQAFSVNAANSYDNWTISESCIYVTTASQEDKDLTIAVSSYDMKGQIKPFANLIYLPSGKYADDTIINEGMVVGAINGKNVEIKYQEGSKGAFFYSPRTVKGNNYIGSILKSDSKITFKLRGVTRTFDLKGFNAAFKAMQDCKPI